MKKIMKKALSLMLALVMVLALAPMSPVTVKADEIGTQESPNALEGGSVTVAVAPGTNYYFDYLAPAAGDYTLTAEVDAEVDYFTVGVKSDPMASWYSTDWSDSDSDGDNSVYTTTVSATMISGCRIQFYLQNSSSTDTWNFTVNINEGATTGGGNEGEADGSQNAPYALEIGTTQAATVEGEFDMVYYGWEATSAGTLTVSVDETCENWIYAVLVNGYTALEYETYMDAYSEPTSADVTVAEGDEILVGVNLGNMYGEFYAGTVNFTTSFVASEGGSDDDGDDSGNEPGGDVVVPTTGTGTEEDPYTMVMGTNTAVLENADTYLYYTYTATEKGGLFLTMSGDNESWFYAGYVNSSLEIDQFVNPNKSWTTNTNSSTDGEGAVAFRTIYLEAGDKVVLRVSTAENADWTRPAGTVVFDAFFLAGLEPEEDEVAKEESVVDYETKLQLGTNNVTLDPTAYTTIFEFEPVSSGVYTITTDNGVVGYWGSGTFFTYDYTENKTDVLEYEIKEDEVGNSIMVGITGEGEATITIEKVGEATERVEIPTTLYENIIWPGKTGKFSFSGIIDNLDDLTYVDTSDDVNDYAIMDENGVYHLNSVDGPVLFVNLADSALSLLDAYSYGQLNGTVKVDGEVVEIIDYNEAYYMYYNYSDNGFYPLTIDLATMLKDIGENQNWYAENGFVGGTYPETAWTFFCYYNEDVTELEITFKDVNGNEYARPEKVEVAIPEDGKLTEEEIDSAIEEAILTNNDLVVNTSDEKVVITFAAEDLRDAEKVALNLNVVIDNNVKDETVAKNDKITDKNFVLKVEFAHNGKLPAKATISITVGSAYKNTTLYYYELTADGTLKYVCDAPVDANGNAKVSQDHCSDYVLLTEKITEKTPDSTGGTTGNTTPEIPDTGDTSNFGLWIAILGLGVVAVAGSVVMKKREF